MTTVKERDDNNQYNAFCAHILKEIEDLSGIPSKILLSEKQATTMGGMTNHLSFSWLGTWDKLLPHEKRHALHHAKWILQHYPNSYKADWARKWIERYERLTPPI